MEPWSPCRRPWIGWCWERLRVRRTCNSCIPSRPSPVLHRRPVQATAKFESAEGCPHALSGSAITSHELYSAQGSDVTGVVEIAGELRSSPTTQTAKRPSSMFVAVGLDDQTDP